MAEGFGWRGNIYITNVIYSNITMSTVNRGTEGPKVKDRELQNTDESLDMAIFSASPLHDQQKDNVNPSQSVKGRSSRATSSSR